jgi:hypothetical protein
MYMAARSRTSSSISSRHLRNKTFTLFITAASSTQTPNLAKDETAAARTTAFSKTTLL